jgi:prolycopene isomerase
MTQQGNEFEVIVIGSGLGGLIAATLLSKKIQPILVLKERGYQRLYFNSRYRFPPFSNLSERCVKTALLQKIVQALGLTGPMSLRGQGKKGKMSCQVILPKARVDLHDDRSLLQEEWRREFPGEVAQIETFYQEMEHLRSLLKKSKRDFFPLQPPSWIRRWLPVHPPPEMTVAERLSPLSKEFRTFIDLQLIASGNLYPDRFPLSLGAYLLSHDPAEEWMSNLDLVKLEQGVSEKFLQSGGKIEEIGKIERVDADWRKGFTVSMGGNPKVYRAKSLIFNSPLPHLSNIEGKGGRLLSGWTRRIQPRYLILPLYMGIVEKVVPVGMADHLVSILDLERPYEGGNLLFVALSPKGDETQAPEGRRALTVQSLMPIEKWGPGSWMECQKGVMSHLSHLIPFLDHYVEFVDADWTQSRVSRWSFPDFIYGMTSDFQWRDGIVPTRISSHLYFTGKENHPYLGFEGEALSGLMVAAQVLKQHS